VAPTAMSCNALSALSSCSESINYFRPIVLDRPLVGSGAAWVTDGVQLSRSTDNGQIDIAVDRLLTALARSSYEDTWSAYQTLIALGRPVIPRIQDVLYRSDLKQRLHPEVMVASSPRTTFRWRCYCKL
jgi:hypothetical protein